MTLQDLLLELAGTLVEDGEELRGELLQLLQCGIRVHVRVPGLALYRTQNV